MNYKEKADKLRLRLIENARISDEPLSYTEAAAGISDSPHSEEFAQLLGDVSEHEWERAFLSATVVYADQFRSKNVKYDPRRGDGLIKRAVSMGLHKLKDFDYLRFGEQQQERAFRDWKDEDYYAKNVTDWMYGQPDEFESPTDQSIQFFTDEELDQYKSFAGTHYDKGSEEDIRQREWLKSTIIPKVRYWADQVKTQFGQEKVTTRRQAQIGDTFKEYIWAGLQRPQDADSGVFFTVDCQGKEGFLKIRLGYDFSDQTNLGAGQRRLAEEQLSTEGSALRLRPSEISGGWEELIEKTNVFISERMEDYRRVVALMGGADNIIEEQVEATDDAPIDPTGSGQDFAALAQRRHEIGTKGEEFVLDLLQKEHPEAKVNLMPNGSRFDIRIDFSTEKCTEVEVKTTSSLDENADFFISQYELDYAKQTNNEYVLIRVTGIDENAPKIAYRLTKDQLLAREHWVTGYRVSGRDRKINKDHE